MRPLFGKFARIVEKALEALTIVGTEPRPDYEEMRRHEHVDEIELQDADRLQGAPVMAYVVRGLWTGTIETLGGQGDTPCLAGRNICPAAGHLLPLLSYWFTATNSCDRASKSQALDANI